MDTKKIVEEIERAMAEAEAEVATAAEHNKAQPEYSRAHKAAMNYHSGRYNALEELKEFIKGA